MAFLFLPATATRAARSFHFPRRAFAHSFRRRLRTRADSSTIADGQAAPGRRRERTRWKMPALLRSTLGGGPRLPKWILPAELSAITGFFASSARVGWGRS